MIEAARLRPSGNLPRPDASNRLHGIGQRRRRWDRTQRAPKGRTFPEAFLSIGRDAETLRWEALMERAGERPRERALSPTIA
jgi:hypothetical protein